MPKNCSECEYQDGCERCYGGLGCYYWKEIEIIKYKKGKEQVNTSVKK